MSEFKEFRIHLIEDVIKNRLSFWMPEDGEFKIIASDETSSITIDVPVHEWILLRKNLDDMFLEPQKPKRRLWQVINPDCHPTEDLELARALQKKFGGELIEFAEVLK